MKDGNDEKATRTYLDKDGNAKKIQKQEDRNYSLVLENEKVSVCKKNIFKNIVCGFVIHGPCNE